MTAATTRDYQAFVLAHPDLRIERDADGALVTEPPAHSRTGRQNFELARQFGNWAVLDGRGTGFDSSTGYDLPNGANRAPDVSWVLNSRLAALSPEEEDGYYPLCPDFVIELRSDTDRLSRLQDKMREYIDNGCSLGWLLDPVQRAVQVYRPGKPVDILENPSEIAGDPELPGLRIDLGPIWK